MSLILCEECQGMVTTDDIGHAIFCSKCTDDGSMETAHAWLAAQPEAVKQAFAAYPPYFFYELKGEGERCQIIRYLANEDDSVTHCEVAMLGPNHEGDDSQVVRLTDLTRKESTEGVS